MTSWSMAHNVTRLPLPSGWPRHVTRAVLFVAALARVAMTASRAWCADSPLARVRLRARCDALEADNAQLREELRIKDARMAAIDPRRRPHYPPPSAWRFSCCVPPGAGTPPRPLGDFSSLR